MQTKNKSDYVITVYKKRGVGPQNTPCYHEETHIEYEVCSGNEVFEIIDRLVKEKALFTVQEIGECVLDRS